MEKSGKRVSLQTIASALGVSIKTVSGAINNDPDIRMSPEKRAKIRALAKELGYAPQSNPRSERVRGPHQIGLIADGIVTDHLATELLRGLDQTLRHGGVSAVIMAAHDAASADRAVAELRRLSLYKIVYLSMHHKIISLNEFARQNLTLMVNCRELQDQIPTLIPAEHDAASTLVEHLFEYGRRRIAFLNLPGLVAGHLREAGFRAAHMQNGHSMPPHWIRAATLGTIHSDRAKSAVDAHITEWMAEPTPPDAIVCGNDRIAIEAYNVLRRLGKSVPDDVAVASFDNHVEVASRLDPPLTTMALPYRRMGRLAAEMLLGLRPLPQGVEEIPFRLVARGSV